MKQVKIFLIFLFFSLIYLFLSRITYACITDMDCAYNQACNQTAGFVCQDAIQVYQGCYSITTNGSFGPCGQQPADTAKFYPYHVNGLTSCAENYVNTSSLACNANNQQVTYVSYYYLTGSTHSCYFQDGGQVYSCVAGQCGAFCDSSSNSSGALGCDLNTCNWAPNCGGPDIPSGICAQPFKNCPIKYLPYNGNYAGCPANSQCCITQPDCTSGQTSCGAFGSNYGANANSCSSGYHDQTCTHDQTQPCNLTTFQNTVANPYNNCNINAGYSPNGAPSNTCACVTTVTVNLHNDYDADGAGGTADGSIDSTVSLDGGVGQTTTSGSYQFTGVAMGNHTITLTLPAGYKVVASTGKTNAGTSNDTTASPNANVTFNLGTNNGSETVDYYISKTYTISGAVYVDYNESGHLAGNSLYTGSDSVTVVGPVGSASQTTQTINNVSYTATNLLPGNYQVTHNPPTGYSRAYPKFATFSVTVGTPGQSPACNTNSYNDATCDANGNITGLNFGITNSIPASTISCADVRIDSGINANIPSTWSCGNTITPNYIQNSASLCPVSANTSAGIGFSGNVDPVISGGGNISASKYQVGNATYPEVFAPRIPNAVTTSYEFISNTVKNSGKTTTSLATACNVASCDLGSLSNGIYTYTGNVTIATSHLTTNTILLLIKGDVTIGGNIIVDPGAVDIFAVTGNIIVSPTVGEVSTTSNAGDVEGLFTTDQSFIIDSAYAAGQHCNLDGTPKDLRANIQGAITTNAKSIVQIGGAYTENRSLCKTNLDCPVDTITARPDMLMYLPALVENTNNVFQEVAPGPGD